MRRITSLLFAVTTVVYVCSTATADEECCQAERCCQGVDLFNGQCLGGWSCFSVDPNATIDDIWRVEDGLLICKGEPLGYLYTEGDYTNYKLIVEWRWAPGKKPGNSGVLLRITGDAQSFLPKCYEAQLMSGSAGNFYGFYGFQLNGPADRLKNVEHETLGKLASLSKIKAAEKEPGQWNKYEITVDGPTITLVINGEEVNRATDCEVVAGKIGLQSEGGEIHFRNVKLVPIEKKSEGVVLFNGKDLDGWSFRAPDASAKTEDTFSVHDGVLRCTGSPAGYLHTDEKYTNYILKLEWRWPEGSNPGNNGLLLRVQGEHFHGNVWPRSIEAQLAHRQAGDIWNIGKFSMKVAADRTQGRHTAKMKPCNEKPQGQWNQYEVILNGTDLTLKVNGIVQNTATDVEEMPGTIALQSEGAPIEFRNIMLTPLGD